MNSLSPYCLLDVGGYGCGVGDDAGQAVIQELTLFTSCIVRSRWKLSRNQLRPDVVYSF